MSLIDEALKRARDQGAPGPAARPAAQSRQPSDPWAYAPLPHARRSSAARRWSIAAVGAAALALGAGIWMSRSGGQAAVRSKPKAAAVPAVAASSPSSAPPAVSREAPAAAPREAGGGASTVQPSAVRSAQGPETPNGSPSLTSAPAPAPPGGEGPKSEIAAKPETPREPAPRPPARAVDGGTYIGALVAPSGARIELGGIVYSEVNPSALLNGRILPVGGVIEGLTISAIEADRVELSADGLTVHLALR